MLDYQEETHGPITRDDYRLWMLWEKEDDLLELGPKVAEHLTYSSGPDYHLELIGVGR